MGKIKIPKNRDIEELVAQEEENGEKRIESMEDVMEQIQNEEQEFRNRLKYNVQYVDKRFQNMCKRRDAEVKDEKRKEAYLKAMNKLEEQEEK